MPALRLIPLLLCSATLAAHGATPPVAPEPPRHEFRFDPRAFDARELQAQAREFAREARERVAQLSRDFVFDADPGTLAWVAGEMGGTRDIVKNAPYTAEAVTETVRVLGDGNRIVRESRATLARDRQGRTRQERREPRGSVVYVDDPIAGRSFALHPERKAVVRLPRVPEPPVPPLPPVPPVPPLPGEAPPAPPAAPGAAPQVEVAPGRVVVRRAGEGEARDVRIEVLRLARGDAAPLAPPAMLALPLASRGKGETKSLGTRDIGGVPAEGTLSTHTIAAGAIGNEKPIVVTSERWFSPDLHVVVYARTVDPLAGETTYRLVNVKREEPPAELFRVPPDYRGAERR